MESTGVCNAMLWDQSQVCQTPGSTSEQRACDLPQYLSPSARSKTPCVPGPFARPQEEGVDGDKPDLCLPGTAPQKTTQLSLASPGHFMKAF